MPVPKRKRSKARRDKRFANKNVEAKSIALCKECQHPLKPHQACASCGFYKGRKIFATKVDRQAVRQVKSKKRPEKSTQESSQETSE